MKKHWRSIAQSYAQAPFFKKYSKELERCFKIAGGLDTLSAINIHLLKFICRELGIDTEIVSSRDLKARGTRTERLANICREVGAKKTQTRPSYLPKTWKSGRETPVAPSQTNVVQQVARNVTDVLPEMPTDDLDVPTFLRRQAKAGA